MKGIIDLNDEKFVTLENKIPTKMVYGITGDTYEIPILYKDYALETINDITCTYDDESSVYMTYYSKKDIHSEVRIPFKYFLESYINFNIISLYNKRYLTQPIKVKLEYHNEYILLTTFYKDFILQNKIDFHDYFMFFNETKLFNIKNENQLLLSNDLPIRSKYKVFYTTLLNRIN